MNFEHKKDKINPGLIQIYTGNGKGKSTAAFGLALRAAGHGFKVMIIQFMKTGSYYGEVTAFKKLAPEIEMFSYGKEGFISRRGVSEEDITIAHQALDHANKALQQPDTDILILDEIINAYYFGLLTLTEIIELLDQKPSHVEVVMTGRNAPSELIKRAHLVTEMQEIKHPYKQDISSRKGIEY